MGNDLSKCQWIFTELGVCFDIVEIWFGTANGQISSILTELSAAKLPYFHFQINFSIQWLFTKLGIGSGLGLLMIKFHQFRTIKLVNINGFLQNLACALMLWSAFGLLEGKFHQLLTELSAPNTSVFYFQEIPMDFHKI